MVIVPLCSHALLILYRNKVVLLVVFQEYRPVIKTYRRQPSTHVILKESSSVVGFYDGRELSLSIDRCTVFRRFMINKDTTVP